MKKLEVVIVIVISVLFLSPSFSKAQAYNQWVMEKWSKDKEKAFKEAKEQEKFVLLFVGRPACGACKDMSELLCNPDNPYKEILEENFVTLYKWYDDENDRADVFEYIEGLYNEREVLKQNRQIPWLFIINPDKPEESVVSSYRPYQDYRPDEETMKNFLLDFLTVDHLSWYVNNEATVLKEAKAQKKFIFKYEGNGTSANGQKMMKQLHDEPLRKILEENYILWFFYNEDDCGCDIETSPNDDLPYIAIIDPESPKVLLEELWGYQEVKTLEDILSKYTVSNETFLPDNCLISVWGNVLLISNQTNNEQINVFSLNGQSLASVRKNDFTIRINVSNFTKGVVIIHSSAGWTKKVLLQ